MRPGETNKRGNIITARIVPVFLLGIIGYTSWVVTDRVCVNYLINPPSSLSVHRETGSAIAILVIFYLLLLVTLISFGRLIQTVSANPGLVPRGEQYWVEKERKRREENSTGYKEEALEYGSTTGCTPRHLRRNQNKEARGFRAQDFWHKDVFVCGWDGRPPFCSTCYNYKPDRAHHCSELGRCVLKMDHFCPWVGGIVSETSFKYFVQFTFWAAVFCLHTLVVMAYYLARRRSQQHGFLNVHWLLALIFAALFFVFAGGMCGSSLQFAFLNSTTIENFTRKTKIWYLAVYLPPRALDGYQRSGRSDLRLITYPRPPEEQFQMLKKHGATLPDESQQDLARQPYDPNTPTPMPTPPQNTYDPQSMSTFASHSAVSPRQETNTPPKSSSANSQQPTIIPSLYSSPPETSSPSGTRTFAILESPPGANPFDIGPMGNFKEVMGYTVFDWLFPLRPSPLVDHSDPVSVYKIGPVVRRMESKANIMGGGEETLDGREDEYEPEKKKTRSRRVNNESRSGSEHRKKKRRRHSTSHGDEEKK